MSDIGAEQSPSPEPVPAKTEESIPENKSRLVHQAISQFANFPTFITMIPLEKR